MWKSEGIDFIQGFLWLDDYVFDGEKEVFKKNGVLQNIILIDLKNKPNQLLEIVSGRVG